MNLINSYQYQQQETPNQTNQSQVKNQQQNLNLNNGILRVVRTVQPETPNQTTTKPTINTNSNQIQSRFANCNGATPPLQLTQQNQFNNRTIIEQLSNQHQIQIANCNCAGSPAQNIEHPKEKEKTPHPSKGSGPRNPPHSHSHLARVHPIDSETKSLTKQLSKLSISSPKPIPQAPSTQETTKKNLNKEFKEVNPNETNSKASHKPRKRFRKKKQQQPKSPSQPAISGINNKFKNKFKCQTCNSTNHKTEYCPTTQPDKVYCDICQETDHITKYCPQAVIAATTEHTK